MLDRDNGGFSESYKPSYELSPDNLKALTVGLIKERASEVPDNYRYIAIEVDGDSKYANIGRHIERVVFEEVFGNDAQQMTDEYGPYESASKFFVSIDRVTEQPAGVLRIIYNSPQGLKTLNDARGEPFNVSIDDIVRQHAITNLDKVWDMGTVAVLPEYRGANGPSSIQLYRAMYTAALKYNIEHMVSIVDDKPLRMLKDYLGIPFIPLASSKPGLYLGSEKSHAVYGHVPEFFEKMSIYMTTVSSSIGRNALKRLINGSEDDSIILDK